MSTLLSSWTVKCNLENSIRITVVHWPVASNVDLVNWMSRVMSDTDRRLAKSSILEHDRSLWQATGFSEFAEGLRVRYGVFKEATMLSESESDLATQGRGFPSAIQAS